MTKKRVSGYQFRIDGFLPVNAESIDDTISKGTALKAAMASFDFSSIAGLSYGVEATQKYTSKELEEEEVARLFKAPPAADGSKEGEDTGDQDGHAEESDDPPADEGEGYNGDDPPPADPAPAARRSRKS